VLVRTRNFLATSSGVNISTVVYLGLLLYTLTYAG
jgi:hypothetical protein